jgi:nitrate/TMAO reductase-like tetraheme cytochrome c subunit
MFHRGVVGIFVSGLLLGALLLAFSAYTLEQTNRTEFCISCHEMEQTVYQEYLKSPHYRNASGVTAGCADCHVPNELGAKLVRKIKATRELYHKLLGTIDTPEKFELKREELAIRVWAEMKANDSRACRRCHDDRRMDPHLQSRRAQEKMVPGIEEGKTCIECHQGIAHALPDDDD